MILGTEGGFSDNLRKGQRIAAGRIKFKNTVTALLVGIALMFGGKAEAVPITIGLEAYVVEFTDGDNLLLGKIGVGDTISGYYTYDSNTTDADVLSDTVGMYFHYEGDYGILLNSGDFAFRSDPENTEFLVSIVNNHGVFEIDNYNLISYNNLDLSNGVSVGHIIWQLDDESGSALDSDALPLTAPVLSDWPDTWFHLAIEGGEESGIGYFIRAEVTSVEIIPEPATAILLTLGTLFLRRKKS